MKKTSKNNYHYQCFKKPQIQDYPKHHRQQNQPKLYHILLYSPSIPHDSNKKLKIKIWSQFTLLFGNQRHVQRLVPQEKTITDLVSIFEPFEKEQNNYV